jgi:hypothetical protein
MSDAPLRPTAMNLLSAGLGKAVAMALAAVILIGCAHKTDANFRRADFSSRRALKSHYTHGGELSEADVIGIDRARTPTDEDIQKALEKSAAVELKTGDSVLVVQSGEPLPDSKMVAELSKHYRAIPFSGIRSDWLNSNEKPKDAAEHAARSLRFAAAQAGAQKILCYWGQLEIARHDLSTKTITWLPVVDVIVPDQKDRVRVHLKLALVDVKSGAWTIFRTEPLQTEAVTTGWSREHLETPEIRDLKHKSYVSAVNALMSQTRRML